jgi:RNA polymerase sigma factor (sigma-70 family)
MAAASTTASDEQLVAAVRAGSDEALEALFKRYRERLTSYVRGIVPDHARAEDIVQETFISALRSMRSMDREIAFRPWVYQIARNACIDQIRRQRRAEEVSFDSDDFSPQEERRISQTAPTTDSRVDQREEMDVLQQALGELPETQQDALVLRELEGRSYDEIAKRMHVSASAVESMIFRARRGLKDEYDQITTGERCRRMHAVIASLAEGIGGVRDERALERHLRHCTACRQEAMAMGLAALVKRSDRRGRMRRVLDRAAALLPFPAMGWRRGGHVDGSLVDRLGGRAHATLTSFGAVGPASEQAAGALPKAIAVLVAAALVGGGGLIGRQSGTGLAFAPPRAVPQTTAEFDLARARSHARAGGRATPVAHAGFVFAGTYDSAGSPLTRSFVTSLGYGGLVSPPQLGSPALGQTYIESVGDAGLSLPATTGLSSILSGDSSSSLPLSKHLKQVQSLPGEPLTDGNLERTVKKVPKGLSNRLRALPPNNPHLPSVSSPSTPSTQPSAPSVDTAPTVDSVGDAVDGVTDSVSQLPAP